MPAPNTDTRPPVDPALIKGLRDLEKTLNDDGVWNLDPQILLWHPPVLAGLKIPTESWQQVDGHPVGMFDTIASRWDEVTLALIEQDPVVFGRPPQAVALFTEGWTLPIQQAAERGDHAKVAEYQRVAARRMMSKHPDRIELRSVTVADAAGHAWMIFRMRGGEPAEDAADGLVPDAMFDFLRRVASPRTR